MKIKVKRNKNITTFEEHSTGVMAKLGLKKEQNLKSKPKHLLLERLSKKKDGLLQ